MERGIEGLEPVVEVEVAHLEAARPASSTVCTGLSSIFTARAFRASCDVVMMPMED